MLLGQSFREFARSALIKHKGQLKCSVSGQPLKSHNPDGGNGFDGQDGRYSEEEDLANAKTRDWNSGAPYTQAAHSMRIKIAELFSASFIMFLFSVSIVRRLIVPLN